MKLENMTEVQSATITEGLKGTDMYASSIHGKRARELT